MVNQYVENGAPETISGSVTVVGPTGFVAQML